MRIFGSFLCALPLFSVTALLAQVALPPGSDIQAAVDANPPGTVFILKAGIHRLRSVSPKDGDVFQGELGPGGERLTTLSGARLLTSFGTAGSLWLATGQDQSGQILGECLPERPRCNRPEDLFIDNAPLVHVASWALVVPGTFFLDYSLQTIYFADNPNGHKVEASVARSAFYGMASNVTVRNLIIEKYATPLGAGAIGDQGSGPGWTVDNNELRWNHAEGLQATTGFTVLNNFIHDNGVLGMGAVGENVLVQGNELSFNRNRTGAWWAWECGGAKFSSTVGLIVRGNKAHDNLCAGLWTDGGSYDTLYENNVVTDNEIGIFHEISYKATIRGNTVRRNGSFIGSDGYAWLWDAQIQLSTSRDVDIYNNTVEVNSDNDGNGICMVQQDRSEDNFPYGPLVTVNNHVHHNTIIVTGSRQHGATGADQDNAYPNIFDPSSNNTFTYNTYYVPDLNCSCYWMWNGGNLTWADWLAAGMDRTGQAYPLSQMNSR